MVVNSGLSVNYSSDRFYKTGNPMDLLYNCETQEAMKLLFMSTEQSLHVLNSSKFFGLNKPGMSLGRRSITMVLGMDWKSTASVLVLECLIRMVSILFLKARSGF